ncbi:MAG TPA: MFS transporter [Porphyromonadaceae bacterium]|jgi:hypothetical protein|nr:MFS transporter [Porphyromonadaceae bacterium]HBL32513.1 MFS transporter [Porphyromonadaceae bacterium]HBX21612.1 MFS transporter [Porphyromonadaceae bacterium]HCM21857.1 MFS transporter [Porphyromonadaceae bacterium]
MHTYSIEEQERVERIIRQCALCYVGLVDKNRRPYVLPMNFGYKDEIIYLHSGPEGKAAALMAEGPEVCLTFCTDSKLIWQHQEVACSYRMRAESVLVYGHVVPEEDFDEKVKALDIIMQQYSGKTFTYSGPAVKNVKIWKVALEEVSAKEFGVPSRNALKYKDRDRF